ncbi:diacylglycerol kinase family lipid kinase [Flammeovirga yaeyamensis]|uniref:Diacylglycerol kinase family lipid kinase n=1 Tax=Flammeovirga yaeyamensis TaxID=367791 RepID=A0AAX1N5R0_9BACT|nr:diacylglycerol kinase family protein [Flammeovirga yaeyamensis]MBB3697466.1 YegS/Rv2252/BmrU family lipid kinase [Flammeovirga yaeyamensis]NMF36160.1 diacylglycerol kinase family lipid kinase [Flammeovirga yaeyamensis]QWG02893.1 diacylglycerol kinase family lipid kinase [Flammeovirga yaeyamensis]
MKKVVLIANPVSGNGKAKKAAMLSASILKENKFDAQIVYTEYAGHATKLSKNLSDKNDIIVAVGGDGTVNEVATGLVGTNCILGIIPNGSGNGLARHLKIPMNTSKAAQCIIKQYILALDAPTINGKHFFCTAGVGFDAHISHVFATMSGRGLKNYIKAIFKEYGGYQTGTYGIQLDQKEEWTQKAFVMTVGNAAQYGNEAFIAPKAKVGDQQLEMTILPSPNLLKGAIWGIRLFLKNIDKSNDVRTFSGRSIQVNSDEKSVNGHRDGEPDTWEYPLIFKVEDQIKVIGVSDN